MMQRSRFARIRNLLAVVIAALLLTIGLAGVAQATSSPPIPVAIPAHLSYVSANPPANTDSPGIPNQLPYNPNAIPVYPSQEGAAPFSSGGGCLYDVYNPPPLEDEPCISVNPSRQVVPDDYLFADAPSGWGGCTVKVQLLDATTNHLYNAPLQNCGTKPGGHYYGPIITVITGHHYYTEVSWDVVYNGKHYYNPVADQSLLQIG
ncbi:MAG TPA: hypothetical protein VH599_15605 [Ktedonobacterales bacterium]|jgi:hypothetical protein